MHVLRNVHGSVAADGLVLDAHPLGTDLAVCAGHRGLGFVDARKFDEIVQAMDAVVDGAIGEGLLEEVASARRHVLERFDDAAELLEEADGWEKLRLPASVRRRLRATRERPVDQVDAVSYRLLRKLS